MLTIDSRQPCWICGGADMKMVKASNLQAPLGAADFRITDAHYGRTAAIYRCEACGFRQASDLPDVLGFYEALDDDEYERSRAARALQARKLLAHVMRHRSSGALLDIGAGSGVLVEEALRLGFAAQGIEPSSWLAARAAARGLPVHRGTLPHARLQGPFDVVALVDVIEHVSDPLALLAAARRVMKPDAVGLVVTPDAGSLAAGLMGRRWWHYRAAHIGYFGRRSLGEALRRGGFETLSWSRASWVFPADYLAARLFSYLPRFLRPAPPRALERVSVPLNLFDSFQVVFRNGA